MKFYLNSKEQIIKDEAYAEYGNVTLYPDYNAALVEYYNKLRNVAADIGKNHTYMNIKIENSTGTVVKSDQVGEYINQ